MIIYSPESPMPAPYDEYVRQRAENIADTLQDVVGDTNVQLCPRAILPEEKCFADDPRAITYGCVVATQPEGYKTALYNAPSYQGAAVYTVKNALKYATEHFQQGNRIRIKDPTESDGQGQHVVETADEVEEIVGSFSALDEIGAVLMPHLVEVHDRLVVGQVNLGRFGIFAYAGREYVTNHQDNEVLGGSDILLSRGKELVQRAAIEMELSPEAIALGQQALRNYAASIIELGRANVDVLIGRTDNGTRLAAAVDVSPRMGGTTPAEVLAIRELTNQGSAPEICQASARLLYNSSERPRTGKNFVDTESLVINANVERTL